MTARARRHALSRNDENVNEAGEEMGYANARIARRSISCVSKISERGRWETEGRRELVERELRWSFREGIPLRVVGRARIFSRPFEVSRSNSRVTNQAANVGRKTGPTLRRQLHTLGMPCVPPFERLNVGEFTFAKVKHRWTQFSCLSDSLTLPRHDDSWMWEYLCTKNEMLKRASCILPWDTYIRQIGFQAVKKI